MKAHANYSNSTMGREFRVKQRTAEAKGRATRREKLLRLGWNNEAAIRAVFCVFNDRPLHMRQAFPLNIPRLPKRNSIVKN
jgi:hypothetical protein